MRRQETRRRTDPFLGCCDSLAWMLPVSFLASFSSRFSSSRCRSACPCSDVGRYLATPNIGGLSAGCFFSFDAAGELTGKASWVSSLCLSICRPSSCAFVFSHTRESPHWS
nr:hypothetical protein [Pandoravirus massiliensis]